MPTQIEVPVFDDHLQKWRVLNVRNYTVYRRTFDTHDEALSSIESRQDSTALIIPMSAMAMRGILENSVEE